MIRDPNSSLSWIYVPGDGQGRGGIDVLPQKTDEEEMSVREENEESGVHSGLGSNLDKFSSNLKSKKNLQNCFLWVN